MVEWGVGAHFEITSFEETPCWTAYKKLQFKEKYERETFIIVL